VITVGAPVGPMSFPGFCFSPQPANSVAAAATTKIPAATRETTAPSLPQGRELSAPPSGRERTALGPRGQLSCLGREQFHFHAAE
jgi:hypothetical protein